MPDSGRPTIVAGLFSRALDVGARCGLDQQQLVGELGIDPAVLEDRDNRLPVESFARLWHLISARCPDRPLALDWIATFKITDGAKQMAMSERTLQRRLQAEGVTFNELLEQARRTIACSYLADRKLAAYEVSFLLGYAEPATFFRAFKRWTGKTPQQYRASALHG